MKMKTACIVFLMLFMLAPMPLAAGLIELPVTGQVKCYSGYFDLGQVIPCDGTGQDGEMRAGVAWPSPRFTNPDNSLPLDGDCVLDRLTGLIWPRDGASALMTWTEAIDYAETFELCGHTDWHLPNINQLESLINANERDTSVWLNSQGFTNIPAHYYWSSTTYHNTPGKAWHMYMIGGNTYFNPKTDTFGAFPVRSSQQSSPDPAYPANLWKTGQLISYHPGDDGDLRRGVAWPDPRFTDNEDGTVTDNLTGLIWLQDADCMFTEYPAYDPDGDGSLYWIEALDFIHGINDGTYANCGAGYFDWRLPNRKEFLSIIDRSEFYPAMPDNNPFINILMDLYFTSTTNAKFTRIPWHMVGRNGYINTFGYLDRHVWPVRGGMAGEEFTYYCDKDNDGYLSSTMEGTCTGNGCEPSDCGTTAGSDCDDDDPDSFPGNTEICGDGLDQDCNGSDLSCNDADGDGILDDGDGSGDPTDNPCTGGNTTDCDDNCPDTDNPLQEDTDGDLVGDLCDNCREVENWDQRDSNAGDDDNTSLEGIQHYGDMCDPDYDNNGLVMLSDFSEWRQYYRQFVPPAPEYVDHDGDGQVGLSDFSIWRKYYRAAPGPGIGD